MSYELLELDLIHETWLDLDLDFKNNLSLNLGILDIRTDSTCCHPSIKRINVQATSYRVVKIK